MGAFRDIIEACGVWLSSATTRITACLTPAHAPLTVMTLTHAPLTVLTLAHAPLTVLTLADECSD